MTDKRFTKVKHIFELNDEGIKDNQTKIEYYYALDLIDLLNELATRCSRLEKENEWLSEFKKRYDVLLVDYNNRACRFEELNEQEEEISNLKSIIEVNGKAYRKSVKEYEEFIEELEQENEQLKKVMNELKDMFQRDIDTGVRSYPLKLSEYLVSALEKIGDGE